MAPTMPLPEDTITFLFTDIEGSTQRWELHPDAMRLALARHDALLRNALEAHSGTIFKRVGDEFCAAFATAPPALAAALTAQRALQAELWGEVGPLRVRMALHTGTAEAREGDYFGPPLNRVSRLLMAGHGGQILLSQPTYELVRDHLPEGASLHDLGERRLPDLVRPDHIYQLVTADLPADFPPLKSLEAFPHNLPVQLTTFIGREREIAEVKGLMAEHRLVSLTGSGGCGKTRLALQVAADLLDVFADGVWLIELAPLADPALISQTVASVLRVREEPGRPLSETLAEVLKPRQLLLLLDNCEHLVAACAELAEALLHACPKLRILASSREALGIAGETPYRVPSLSVPDARLRPSAGADTLSALTQYEAVQLFIDRAVTALPGFKVTNENAPAVAQVCHRLDGIPLAIELATARIKVLPVEQIAARLDDRFRLLTGGSRTALPRQQTLRALIDWSYDLLSEPERTLLRRLSVFAGGWTLETAEQVCAGNGVDEWEVLDLLSRLVDKSLVAAEEQRGEGRYRLLETVRQYSRERLLESGEGVSVRGRHRDWFVALAERAGPALFGPEQAAWLNQLEMEHDNLRAAIEWSAEIGAVEAGLRIGAAVWRFWHVRGYRMEGRERLAHLLSRPEAAGHTVVRAKALDAAGVLAATTGDLDAGRSYYDEMLTIGRELDNKPAIAAALNGLGEVALFGGNPEEARALYEESLAISRKAGDRWNMAFSLMCLGRFQGDYEAARSLYEESLAAFRELADKRSMAFLLTNMGDKARHHGDLRSARTRFEESLAIRRELGDRGNMAWELSRLGSLAQEQGDYTAARALLEESLAIQRELSDKEGIAWSLLNLGQLARCQSDDETARALYQESLAIGRELNRKPLIASSLSNLGPIVIKQSDLEGARSLLAESLRLGREVGAKWAIAEALEGSGYLAAKQGKPDRAARLLGAAEATRESIGAALRSFERADYEHHVAHARDGLGEEAFKAAWADGRAMSLEEAIEFALEAE